MAASGDVAGTSGHTTGRTQSPGRSGARPGAKISSTHPPGPVLPADPALADAADAAHAPTSRSLRAETIAKRSHTLEVLTARVSVVRSAVQVAAANPDSYDEGLDGSRWHRPSPRSQAGRHRISQITAFIHSAHKWSLESAMACPTSPFFLYEHSVRARCSPPLRALDTRPAVAMYQVNRRLTPRSLLGPSRRSSQEPPRPAREHPDSCTSVPLHFS